MKLAYVDTSCLVAVAFEEPRADAVRGALAGADRLLASNLLEAEWRSALVREDVTASSEAMIESISWILPNRSLRPEIDRVLASGYLRGADAWHLACALFLDPGAAHLLVLTLDEPQRIVAERLGFAVGPPVRARRVKRSS